MKYMGENLARIRAKFDLNLKEYGLTNPGIGSPAVAETWQVSVTLLGVPQ